MGRSRTIFWEKLHKAFLEKYPKSAMNDLIRDRILPAIADKTLEMVTWQTNRASREAGKAQLVCQVTA